MGRQFEDIVEGLIDQVGLTTFLRTVESVCHSKAAHLEANWQDKVRARLWSRVASKLDKVTAHAESLGL